MKKRFMSALAICLAVGICSVNSVSASENITIQSSISDEMNNIDIIEPYEIIEYPAGEAPRPNISDDNDKLRSFNRTYVKKIDFSTHTEIMYDTNTFLNDDTVRVTLVDDGKNGTQPVEIIIFEYSPFGDKGYIYKLNKGNSTGARQIKEGNNFSVFAKYVNSTTAGNIEVNVSLQPN